MENCKKEFLEHTEGSEIICVQIFLGDEYEKNRTSFFLKRGYSEKEFENFCETLDFKYDSGYGGQKVHGLIWYKDGTWSDRGEYDGSEWWVHQSCPEIPKNL